MKKVLAILLTLLLLAVPAFASGNQINDNEGLLSASETAELETLYADYAVNKGFTPILVTTDSFGGQSAEDYAGDFYDDHGYPEDGILLLVSLTEGEWYILTNGNCYIYLGDWDLENMGQIVVEDLRSGNYYNAFVQFPALAEAAMAENAEPAYGMTIVICMGIGLLIGLIAVGIMSAMMKSVRSQSGAADYMRAGSMHLSNQRDIFLYSQVTRTPKPKNTSSGSSGGGGSRGGAGGKI